MKRKGRGLFTTGIILFLLIGACSQGGVAAVTPAVTPTEKIAEPTNATVKATETPVATATAVPTGTNTPVPTATNTPSPTPTIHVHEYIPEITEATCLNDGLIVYVCECGDSYTETIPALGHDIGEWYVSKEPELEVCGEMRRDCSRCGYHEVMKTAPIVPEATPTPTPTNTPKPTSTPKPTKTPTPAPTKAPTLDDYLKEYKVTPTVIPAKAGGRGTVLRPNLAIQDGYFVDYPSIFALPVYSSNGKIDHYEPYFCGATKEDAAAYLKSYGLQYVFEDGVMANSALGPNTLRQGLEWKDVYLGKYDGIDLGYGTYDLADIGRFSDAPELGRVVVCCGNTGQVPHEQNTVITIYINAKSGLARLSSSSATYSLSAGYSQTVKSGTISLPTILAGYEYVEGANLGEPKIVVGDGGARVNVRGITWSEWYSQRNTILGGTNNWDSYLLGY